MYSTISLIDLNLLLNDLIKFDCNYLRGKLLFSIGNAVTKLQAALCH